MLLRNFGLKFQVEIANINEYIPEKIQNIPDFACGLAFDKAKEVSEISKGVIIGADTVVNIGNKILGKPSDVNEASKMLHTLSGKTHKVITGIAIINNITNKTIKTFETTSVTFRKLSLKEIKFYVSSGSPMDKAGAYGIQDDFGSTFVSKINGDYFNVVGLPIVKTYLALSKMLNFKM
jgi:septum formation protein